MGIKISSVLAWLVGLYFLESSVTMSPGMSFNVIVVWIGVVYFVYQAQAQGAPTPPPPPTTTEAGYTGTVDDSTLPPVGNYTDGK